MQCPAGTNAVSADIIFILCFSASSLFRLGKPAAAGILLVPGFSGSDSIVTVVIKGQVLLIKFVRS